jgi:hypothetical protein
MATFCGPERIGCGVGVLLAVGVLLGVDVLVAVFAGVGVDVLVCVLVGVDLLVGAGVLLGVGVNVALGGSVPVDVADGVSLGVWLADGLASGVAAVVLPGVGVPALSAATVVAAGGRAAGLVNTPKPANAPSIKIRHANTAATRPSSMRAEGLRGRLSKGCLDMVASVASCV